jgi:hypothetical protein
MRCYSSSSRQCLDRHPLWMKLTRGHREYFFAENLA